MKCPKCGSEKPDDFREIRSEWEAEHYRVILLTGGDYLKADKEANGLSKARRFACRNCGHEEKVGENDRSEGHDHLIGSKRR
jgi:DNA-directed RNA polymerase subunit M/transcription elongation factor TFIIS